MLGLNLANIAEFINTLGLRKWTTSLVFAGLLTLLVRDKAIASTDFVELFKWLIMAAFGGNVLEYYVKAKFPETQGGKQDPPAATA